MPKPGRRCVFIRAADEQTARQRELIMRRLTIGSAILAALLMLGTTAYTAVAMRTTQLTNGPTLHSANHAAHSADRAAGRIEECTTPGQPCYNQGQRQIAGAVGDISTANAIAAAAAAYCASQMPSQTFATIYACTVKRAAQARHAGPPIDQ